MLPYLTDDEIRDLCRPLVMRAAMVRHLQAMGLQVRRRPDGWPIVGRAHFEQVCGARVQTQEPAERPAGVIPLRRRA